MKRCRWCKRVIWPWQHRRRSLHLACLRVIHQLTLRDDEVHGV